MIKLKKQIFIYENIEKNIPVDGSAMPVGRIILV
jgi:hypothetical protein